MRDLDTISAALRSLGESAPDAPPFARVWRAAQARQLAQRSRRPWLAAAVLLPAVALVVVLLVPAPGFREPVPELSEEELARALSNWEAPLDFLLEAPGGDLLGYQSDTLGSTLLLDLSFPDPKESLQ